MPGWRHSRDVPSREGNAENPLPAISKSVSSFGCTAPLNVSNGAATFCNSIHVLFSCPKTLCIHTRCGAVRRGVVNYPALFCRLLHSFVRSFVRSFFLIAPSFRLVCQPTSGRSQTTNAHRHRAVTRTYHDCWRTDKQTDRQTHSRRPPTPFTVGAFA